MGSTETKAEFLARIQKDIDAGHPANYERALEVAIWAHKHKQTRNGGEFIRHPQTVLNLCQTKSPSKEIICLLHDVVEDSDLTLEDLYNLGFSDRIILGLDAVTKRKDEKYVEFIQRCARSFKEFPFDKRDDAIDVKLADLSHNCQTNRYQCAKWTAKERAKMILYNISYYYLLNIKRENIDADMTLMDYIKTQPIFYNEPEIINALMDEFSTSSERLPVEYAYTVTAPDISFNPLAINPAHS